MTRSDGARSWKSRRASRRSVLRGSGIVGLGLAGAWAVGCGEDDDEPTATPTATSSATTAAGTATAAATPVDPFPGVKRGGTIHLTLAGDPPTLSPFANTSFLTKGFAVYVYSRLYKLNTGPDIAAGAAEPTPDLAESSETSDGQEWVVRLRQGAKFQNLAPVNGRAVTAEDVLYSWDAFQVDTNVNREAFNFVQSVEAIDDHTLRFSLDAPSAVFLDSLADANLLFVMPTESDGGFDPALTAIGSGPWIFDGYDISQIIKWKRNPDYFVEGLPFADAVEQAIVPEYANRIAQFQAGNTHIEGINANDVLTMRGQLGDVQWRGTISALTSIFYFDHINNPANPWSDARVRQAVSMAIDRDALMDLAYNVRALKEAGLNVGTGWNNQIPVGHTRWWLDPQSAEMGPFGRHFQYLPDEARKLLDAVSPGGLDVKYQYTANRYGSTFNSVAEANIGYLSEAGFNIDTEVQDYSSQYIAQTSDGNFEGLAFGYETPFSEAGTYAVRPFSVDENGEPITKNRSRVVDARLIEIAKLQAGAFEFEERRELLNEMQRINAEHMYYIPNQAGAGTGWTAYQPEVRGIRETRGYGAGIETIAHTWLDT